MSKAKYSLTEEHRAQLKPWADRLIKIAMRTTPQTPEERSKCIEAIHGLYDAAKLEHPKHVVFCASPIGAAIAATIAAGAWYLREHPEFMGAIPEPLLMQSVQAACSIAVSTAMGVQVRVPEISTYAATRAATDAATDAATHAATNDATRAATRAATNAATSAATRAATYDATDAATSAATRDATDAATRAATYDATRAADIVGFLLGCCRCYYSMWDGGNQCAGWSAYLSAGRHIYGLPIDYSKWAHYEMLAELAGPRLVHPRFAIVSDFPTRIGRDEQNRAHCSDGPQIAWADGWEAHYWHGVKVPKRLIEDPESYTTEEIREIRNSEVSRALAERMGWGKFVEKLGARVIDSCEIEADGEDGQHCTLSYELLESERFADAQPRWLRMQSPMLNDGTQPSYLEPVDPGLATAAAARTWKTRRADGSWPTTRECNRGLQPDWSVRHGDVVLHAIETPSLDGLKKLPGNVLVAGIATGHSHVLIGEANVYELHDGCHIVERIGETLAVKHQEHKTTALPSRYYRQSIARQYDRENGWVNVED